ncbi:hypothetical protein CGK59_05855, partial [Vibrio parahaemolyticus]
PASILPWAHTEQLAKRLKISANFFMTFHYNYQASSTTECEHTAYTHGTIGDLMPSTVILHNFTKK